MNAPVITGLGVVCALGVGRERFWERLLAGQTGLRDLVRFDTAGLRNRLGGEVPEDEWQACPDAGLPRPQGYAAQACREALAQAGLAAPEAAVFATNFGGQHAWHEGGDPRARFLGLDFHAPATTIVPTTSTVTLSNACSSGTNAVGHAADLVRLGLAETAVACAFDELGMFCLSGLSILHTITADTIRPFDRKRSGTLFGEGAAALVVESLESATERGVEPLATVLGYGVNNNGYHMTAPDRGGEGMALAIARALEQAELPPTSIDHINAHATGTEYHDPAETQAIKSVLGDHAYRVPVSAIKAATGHAMGAAGAMEAVACVLALRDGLAPPTLNLDEPDPECDLDCVTGVARAGRFDVVLSVSAGLGGNNSAILLGRPAWAT